MTVAAAAVLALSCGENDSEPRVSLGRPLAAPQQHGPKLAFARSMVGNPPRYDLAVSDARGHGLRLLTGDSKRGSVRPALFARGAWSPDARRIAFTAVFDTRGFSNDIYVVNADGSGARRLTHARDARHPVWTPDGRTIVFARTRALSGCGVPSSLWSVDAAGSNLRRLTDEKDDTSELPGSFSPDGERLAFTRADLRPTAGVAGGCLLKDQLFVLDLAQSRERQLTDDGADPAFSPDGERIAFVSARDRNGTLNYGDRTRPAHELYVMRSDGSDPRRLTRTNALNEGSPSWLPDGTRLAYHRGEQTGNAEAKAILQINPDGSCPTPVLADRRLSIWFAAPAWRPGSLRSGGGPLQCATGKEKRGGAHQRGPQAGAPPRTDAEKIRHVHRQYFKEVARGDGEAACRLLTSEYRAQLVEDKRRTDPGIDCPTAVLSGSQVFKGYEPRLERVRVRGDSARALDPGRRFPPQTVTFKRIGQDWKVFRVRTHYRR